MLLSTDGHDPHRGAAPTGATMNFARLGGANASLAVLWPEDSDDPSARRRATIPDFIKNATYDDNTRLPKGFDPKEDEAHQANPTTNQRIMLHALCPRRARRTAPTPQSRFP